MRFLLALTCGMLAFLLIETLEEALEFANEASSAFQGTGMVLLVASVTFLALISVGRRKGNPSGMALAVFLALGIGQHNLGEGLALSSALRRRSVSN